MRPCEGEAPGNAAGTSRVKDVPRELHVPAPFCTLGTVGATEQTEK
jgi:hypothetical protein